MKIVLNFKGNTKSILLSESSSYWGFELSGVYYICFSIIFLITPSASMTTGTVCIFIPHILVVSILDFYTWESFSATLTDVFRSDGTTISISIHGFSCLFLMIMSG